MNKFEAVERASLLWNICCSEGIWQSGSVHKEAGVLMAFVTFEQEVSAEEGVM